MSGWRLALGIAALVGAASLALPATLGYDAWAWTVWGRQLAHLDLATTAGPASTRYVRVSEVQAFGANSSAQG